MSLWFYPIMLRWQKFKRKFAANNKGTKIANNYSGTVTYGHLSRSCKSTVLAEWFNVAPSSVSWWCFVKPMFHSKFNIEPRRHVRTRTDVALRPCSWQRFFTSSERLKGHQSEVDLKRILEIIAFNGTCSRDKVSSFALQAFSDNKYYRSLIVVSYWMPCDQNESHIIVTANVGNLHHLKFPSLTWKARLELNKFPKFGMILFR